MAHSAKYLPNYTYDDYINWEGRWEIIDGIPYAMTPMPSPAHQRIAARLNTLISNALTDKDCDCSVYHPIDLKITKNTVVNPNLLVMQTYFQTIPGFSSCPSS